MNRNEWNPGLYLRFNRERIQPSIDLISRINYEKPGRIIDIGCGPGNSTQALFERWPDAKITGIDNSPAMIKKAATDYPDRTWKLVDAGRDEIGDRFDIAFSNAAIQWIPHHERLLRKLHSLLNGNGVLAIQIPLFWDMPLGKSIKKISEDKRWEELTRDAAARFTIHNSTWYYDALSQVYGSIEMWETDYIHIMKSHNSILEMIRSTGLKPYMERLGSREEKKTFANMVIQKIREDYPRQKDGTVLFPFKRLFFIAGR